MSKEIKGYVDSADMQRRLYKRTLRIVVISQLFGGAGLAAGITVGALLAQEMLGGDRLAGVPAALFTLGSAAAALLVGRLSQRFGRRFGLSAGFLVGGLGAMGVVWAAVAHNPILLLASLFVYGAGTATNLQARYAGTDLAQPTQRATAISIAMVSTTLGAVAGPNMVSLMGRFATAVGVPPLAGPFILASAAFMLAGLAFLVLLRPDPLLVAQAIAQARRADHREPARSTARTLMLNRRLLAVGAAIMVLTQMVMIAIMTMTPVHMRHHGHTLADVGLIIGIHVAAMFLPSLITGVLVDRVGRTPMSIAAGVTLLVAGIVAAFAPADSMPVLAVALALLGLGWNFGLISGTALVVDATDPDSRAKAQGTIDVMIALAGASGGALSGMVVANSSYATLSLAGGGLALLLMPVVLWSRSGGHAGTEERRGA